MNLTIISIIFLYIFSFQVQEFREKEQKQKYETQQKELFLKENELNKKNLKKAEFKKDLESLTRSILFIRTSHCECPHGLFNQAWGKYINFYQKWEKEIN